MKGIGLALLVVLVSCADDPDPVDWGYQYQPLGVGLQWTYEVTETMINQQVETTRNYELKITITDSALTGENRYYVLSRETRLNETEEWQPLDTWSITVSTNQLIQNESNINFVKLRFPLGPAANWDGNQYNNLPDNGNLFNGTGSELYRVTHFEKPLTLSTGLTLEKTITVVQNDFTDPIVGQDQRHEVYGADVGLVEKKISQLEYCTTPNCLGQQQVATGYVYSQTLKSYAL